MGLYAALLHQGVGPRQIDETELEDLFAMLGGNDDAGAPLATIDAIMGG